MKTLGDLRQTIHGIWEFVVPPFINLSIIVGILLFTSNKLELLDPDIVLPGSEVFTNSEIISLLKSFKLESAVPILSLLLVLFLLNFTNRVIKTIGAFVPIDFTYNQTYLYIQNSGFFEFWLLYPEIEDPNQLISRIESRMDEERNKESTNGKTILALDSEFERNYEKITFIKFLIVMIAYCFTHDIFTRVDLFYSSRLLLALILSIIVLFYFFTYTARNWDIRVSFFIYRARELEINDGRTPLDFSQHEKLKKLQDKLELHRTPESKKWWWLILSIHRLNWMKYITNYRLKKPNSRGHD